jgi:hypothetical protein
LQPLSAAVLFVAGALALVGCAGAPPVGQAGTSQAGKPAAPTSVEEDPTTAGVAPGSWTGTITFHAVANVNKTTNDTSGDPGNVYYETSTTTEANAGDSVDTFAINARDGTDLEFGISAVELDGGKADTHGNEDYKTTIVTKKSNSGCTWTEELGDEVSGSWADSGTSVGELRFSDDGSYSIELRASTAGPDGVQPDGPQIDHRMWIKNSDISAGCSGDPAYDTTAKEGPTLLWASNLLGQPDVNGIYSAIQGKLDATNPGTTVDGTSTWKLVAPAQELTITWHLVHSTPIVLPHD